jgi:hypothetical protein
MDFLYVSDLVKYVNTLGNLARQLERELASANARADAAEKALKQKELDRQYHMDAINKIAKAVGALGETSDSVAVMVESRLREVKERVRKQLEIAGWKAGISVVDTERFINAIDLDKIVAEPSTNPGLDAPRTVATGRVSGPACPPINAAPQVLTAKETTAPSQEGVGQGAPASAANPQKD